MTKTIIRGTVWTVLFIVVAYVALSVIRGAKQMESYKAASAFCSSIKSGASKEDVMQLAHRASHENRISDYPQDLFVNFGHTCTCRMTVNGRKIFPRGAWCED